MGVADYLWLARGNTILNSVNSPGFVSTSILPPQTGRDLRTQDSRDGAR
jgi:hypothetical protein